MKKQLVTLLTAVLLGTSLLTGCAGKETAVADNTQSRQTETDAATVQAAKETKESGSDSGDKNSDQAAADEAAALEDGVYRADFDTDSGMFHVSEACGGKGTLTVKDGEMVIHISLGSKNILNLYPGLAADAQKEGAKILQPTVDTVTYSDGLSEEVYGFDVPVPVLNEEFDLALIGKKGTWYDHKVSVSNPVKEGEETALEAASLEDGEYEVNVTLEGGSGKAFVASPAKLTVREGKAYARIEWSSSSYDYMKIGEDTYYPVNTEGNSVFEIPVEVFDQKIEVVADTVAMGTPHEVSYTLTFSFQAINDDEPAVSCVSPQDTAVPAKTNPILPELTYAGSMDLDYAEEFTVDYYDGGYTLITISDGSRFLVIPEKKEAPKALDQEITVLKQPVNQIYLAASAAMDMFVSMDALEHISLSGTKEDDWYIKEAKDAMATGIILYAGKYNMPDYELILSADCGLAIESNMISHAPEVKEKLESFGIPVLTDLSSYESHPLGRTEWVKLYGVLTGKEEQAEAAYNEQKAALDSIVTEEKERKSVAFFFVTSNGAVNVRKSQDYVPKMIELAGGTYVFHDLGNDSAASMNLQMEEFYARAKDADYLVYNGTIDGGLKTRKELLQKIPMLEEFKAYSNGNVFCTTKNLYQESMKSGNFIRDLYQMMSGEETGDETFQYLFRLE